MEIKNDRNGEKNSKHTHTLSHNGENFTDEKRTEISVQETCKERILHEKTRKYIIRLPRNVSQRLR